MDSRVYRAIVVSDVHLTGVGGNVLIAVGPRCEGDYNLWECGSQIGLLPGQAGIYMVTLDLPPGETSRRLRKGDTVGCVRSASAVAAKTFPGTECEIGVASMVADIRPTSKVSDHQMRRDALTLEPTYALPGDLPDFQPDYSSSKPLTPDQIEKVVAGLDVEGLTEERRSHFVQTIRAYSAIFDMSSLRQAGPATAEISYHGKPVNHSFMVKDPVRMKALREHVDNMIKTGVLEPTTSAFSSPSFVVPKPNQPGKFRFVTDFRKMNEHTQQTRGGPPSIDVCLNALHDKPYRSQLDLTSAFWQLCIRKEDRPKTATMIPGVGFFQYTRMPMGAINSSAVLQCHLSRLFARQLFESVLVFADDILIYSSTIDQHLEDLRLVLAVLYRFGHTVNLAKSTFFAKQVNYLGYVIEGETVRPGEKYLGALERLQPPRSLQEARSALGLFSFLRRFVPKYAEVAKPLVASTRKYARVGREARKAFEELKANLLKVFKEDKRLYLPNPGKTLFISTDASNRAVGGFVYHLADEDGKHSGDNVHPIGFSSRGLTDAEDKYRHLFAIDRTGGASILTEALALIYMLEMHDDLVHMCKNTVVNTDHLNLTYLRHQAKGVLFRWALRLMAYAHVKIRYVSGKTITIADALSRLTLDVGDKNYEPILVDTRKPDGWRAMNELMSHDDSNQRQLCAERLIIARHEDAARGDETRATLELEAMQNGKDRNKRTQRNSAGTEPMQRVADIQPNKRAADIQPYSQVADIRPGGGKAGTIGCPPSGGGPYHPSAADLGPLARAMVSGSPRQRNSEGTPEEIVMGHPESDLTPGMRKTKVLVKEKVEFPARPPDTVVHLPQALPVAEKGAVTETDGPDANTETVNEEAARTQEEEELTLVTLRDIQASQRKYLEHLFKGIEEGKPRYLEKYEVNDGVIYAKAGKKIENSGRDIVQVPHLVPYIPWEDHRLRRRMVAHQHRAGPFLGAHPGAATTEIRVRNRAYWNGIRRDVRAYVGGCIVCKMAKHAKRNHQGLYQLREGYPHRDGDIIAYDHIIIDQKGPNKEIGIAVIVDYYSQYCVLYPITSQRHEYLLEQFERFYMTTYGVPNVMIADSELNSSVWKTFSRMLRMKLAITTTYHPQANPVERRNRDVQVLLRTFMLEARFRTSGRATDAATGQGDGWPAYLPYVQAALNDQPVRGLNVTPYQVKFGFPYRSAADLLMTNNLPDLPIPTTVVEYVKRKRKTIKWLRNLVHRTLVENRAGRILKANQSRAVTSFRKGDYVMRYIKTRQPKTAFRAIGPYRIVRKRSGAVYEIEHVVTKEVTTAHAMQLVRHVPLPDKHNLMDAARPHIRQDKRALQVQQGDMIVWSKRHRTGVDLGTELFVSQLYQWTPRGYLLHHYMDVDDRHSGDFTRPLEARKLAPGYEAVFQTPQREYGTWRPRHGDVPLVEWRSANDLIVHRVLPRTELTEEKGWSEQAKAILRSL